MAIRAGHLGLARLSGRRGPGLSLSQFGLAFFVACLCRLPLSAQAIMGFVDPGEWMPGPSNAGANRVFSVLDGAGRPVPFPAYRIAGQEGRGDALGRFSLAVGPGSWRLEVSAGEVLRLLDIQVGSDGQAGLAGLGEARGLRSQADGSVGIVLDRAPGLREPYGVDICIILDGTASMAPNAAGLKPCLLAFLDGLKAEGGLSPRLSLLILSEGPSGPALSHAPFMADGPRLRQAIGQYRPSGGEDPQEALSLALARSCGDGSAWDRRSARFVFVISDAANKDLPGSEGALESARAMGIRIVSVGLGQLDRGAREYLRGLALETRGGYIEAAKGTAPGPRSKTAIGGRLEDLMLDALRAELAALRSSAGSPGLGSDTGNPGGPAIEVLAEAQRRIAERLTYPEAARLRGLKGKTRLRLILDKDGSLIKAKVESSSGSQVLDESSLNVAKSVFPLKNPAGRRLELSIELDYRLDGGSEAPGQ